MALTEQMKSYLEKSHEDAKSIVMELCKIPAPSHHELERAKWCEKWLKEAGAKKVFIDDAYNAICEHNVRPDGDVVVIMAHLDTVFPDLEPMPFVEKDGLYHSPGVTDDTGNLASLIVAFRYVIQNNIDTKCGLVFVANSCEEGLGNLKIFKSGSAVKISPRAEHDNILYGYALAKGSTIKAKKGDFLTFKVGDKWIKKHQITLKPVDWIEAPAKSYLQGSSYRQRLDELVQKEIDRAEKAAQRKANAK